jgi:hypothetical protein
MLITTISISNESILANKYFLMLVFSPIIIYSFSILINIDFLNQIIMRLFVIAFTVIYTSLIFYNIIRSSFRVLPIRGKYLLISSGISLILLFSGFRQADFISELSSILSVVGCFLLCFGLITESSLELHNHILSSLINSLKVKKKKNFLKYLKKIISENKDLKASVKEDIKLHDNPSLSNIEEKNLYNEIILRSYTWHRRYVKGSEKKLSRLKKYYNKQAYLTKKLSMFLI